MEKPFKVQLWNKSELLKNLTIIIKINKYEDIWINFPNKNT